VRTRSERYGKWLRTLSSNHSSWHASFKHQTGLLVVQFGNAGALADELRGLQADCVRNRLPAAIRNSAGDEVDFILPAGDVFGSSERIQDAVLRQVIQAFTALAELRQWSFRVLYWHEKFSS
jgi:hypothetical protein